MMTLIRNVVTCVLLAAAVRPSFAQDDAAKAAPEAAAFTVEQLEFFERRVRPLLIEHCLECHSGEKLKGSLSLESRASLLLGGDSGPAVVAGKPEASLLISAIRYDRLEMPPKGQLSADQIGVLTTWVRDGAAWPGGGKAPQARPREHSDVVTDEDRQHWAFQPVRPVPVPAVVDAVGTTVSHPIDAFVFARLTIEQLQANAQTDTRTIIRRAYFGLTGLPPTFEELDNWTRRIGGEEGSAFQETAYAELLDELLSRPAYGEHWARHWLDVVRFAQSNGYERDGYKPWSWRYRDYVVKAFQDDKPYDRFVLEQLAGDELPDANGESRTATGFYRLGVWDDEPDDKRQAEFDELDDVMVTLGASFFGLTIGCARCHEHKFDPIPQADYYRLLAFLRNIRRYENPQTTAQSATTLPINDDDAVRRAVAQVQERVRQREQAIAAASNAEERKKLEAQQVDQNLPGLDWALSVRENANEPPPTNVLIRGSAGSPGPLVTPGFPQVLCPTESASSPDATAFRSESPLNDLFPTSGRRLALARWMVRPEHPLTARVIVNRVWHYHFGTGLVATTGDFGRAGDAPSHPGLLDWLAADFVQNGWSIKRLHRQILTSAAFRRSSHIDAQSPAHQAAIQKDPANRFLWRFPLRRLDAESIRDRLLLSSGELNTSVGGREMYPLLSGEVLAGQSKPGLGWEPSPQTEQCRRSLYAIVKRSVRDPLLESLDYSNTTSPLTERPITTVAPQALILLHGRFTAERSAALAERLSRSETDPARQIERLFQTVLQRSPSERELGIALDTLHRFEDELAPRLGRLTFRPDVPVSLFSGYRKQLAASAFLLGPTDGWQYRGGVWGGGYEGIDVVDPRLGPHAFWRGGEFRSGTLTGRLRIEQPVELVTLIARGRPDGDAWRGLAVTLDRTRGVVEWRDRSSGTEPAETPETPNSVLAQILAQQWLPFRWELTDGQSRFVLGEADQPLAVLERRLAGGDSAAGQLGIAVWGGQVEFDALTWSTAESGLPADLSKGSTGEQSFELARTSIVGTDSPLPTGWSRYDGSWQRQTDGSWLVGQSHGAKIVWDQQPVATGEVRVEMQMTPGKAHIGGLLLCVSEPKIGADNWFGYEVSLDTSTQTLLFGDHRNNFRDLKRQPVAVKPGEWHTLRAVLGRERLQVFVDGADQPAIDEELVDRLQGEMVGLRTWGSEIRFRNFEIRRPASEQGELDVVRAEWPAPRLERLARDDDQQRLKRDALAALCRTIFNLNEFVYVE